ncbi:MAG: beta-N-acetylhexosaminidase [Pseudomonadota bacterium]
MSQCDGPSRTCGATILDADGLRLSADEIAFFREADPFGFILFARNIEHPDQVRALCADMRNAVGRDCLITIDQEGGRVQRLRAPIWREWLPPLDFVAAAGARAERAMYLRYALIAEELTAIGIDSNCAPMVDVAEGMTHDFLRNRCYGTDPKTVAALGRAAGQGMLDHGVLPIVKHIPGHGRATMDSHFDLPRVAAGRNALNGWDFAPFAALADMPMAMTAHIVYAALDEAPATLSPKVIEVIRQDIGFEGLLMTDDIAMNALQGDLAANAASAIAAGCDVVLHCNGTLAERQAVAAAAGTMTPGAQARADAVMARRRPAHVDFSVLDAELEALMGGQGDG